MEKKIHGTTSYTNEETYFGNTTAVSHYWIYNAECDLYIQKEDTAMGTIAAPPYACLVTGYLEETKLFPEFPSKHFKKEECEQY